MDKEAHKEGIQPIDIANKYIDTVLDDFRALNILAPNGQSIPQELTHEGIKGYGWPRATEYIEQMIDIIKRIESNGYTYETEQALYFDVTKIPDYTIFTGQRLEEKEEGVREEVGVDPNKKNPADFVLWMKKVGKYANHIMSWQSPWGEGFPGWHIECTAMSTSILGENFDIHTGGIDHVPVHHPNERAQNIGAFGHDAVKYWIHNEWLVTKDDSKLSKSEGNATDLPGYIELGYDPMDIRFLFASINYRTRIQMSQEALDGARNARLSIKRRIEELGDEVGNVIPEYVERFKVELENNLNMSEVFALLNEVLKSEHEKGDILATVLEFDKVLGLNLNMKDEKEFNPQIEQYAKDRDLARTNKDYTKADEYRKMIEDAGYIVMDTPERTKYRRK
jgi:cysteinyl-tRNA synthetase